MYISKSDLGEFLTEIHTLGAEARSIVRNQRDFRMKVIFVATQCVVSLERIEWCREIAARIGRKPQQTNIFDHNEESFVRLCRNGPSELNEEELVELVLDADALKEAHDVVVAGGSADDVRVLDLLVGTPADVDADEDPRLAETLGINEPTPQWVMDALAKNAPHVREENEAHSKLDVLNTLRLTGDNQGKHSTVLRRATIVPHEEDESTALDTMHASTNENSSTSMPSLRLRFQLEDQVYSLYWERTEDCFFIDPIMPESYTNLYLDDQRFALEHDADCRTTFVKGLRRGLLFPLEEDPRKHTLTLELHSK